MGERMEGKWRGGERRKGKSGAEVRGRWVGEWKRGEEKIEKKKEERRRYTIESLHHSTLHDPPLCLLGVLNLGSHAWI